MNRRTGILTAAGLLLLALLWLSLWPGGGYRGTLDREARAPRAGKLTALSTRKPLSPAVLRRSATIDLGAPLTEWVDPYDAWSTEEILDHFGVPPGEFKEATMAEVGAYLEMVYADHGGRGIGFRVEGGGGHPVTCSFGNVSARGLIDLVAGLGGYEVLVGDGEVLLRRKASGDGGAMQTLRLDAGFSDQLSPADSPFGDAEIGGVAAVTAALRDCLEGFGIGLGEQAGVEFDPETGVISITCPEAESDRIRTVADFLMGGSRAGRVLISSKGVSAEAARASFVEETLSDPQFQSEIRRLSQIEGASLTGSPSVVTAGGQRALVQIVREVLVPIGWEGGQATRFETMNVGLTMDVAPIVLGLDRVGLSGEVNYTTVGGQVLDQMTGVVTNPKELAVAAGLEKFLSHKTAFEGLLYDGNTAAFLAAEDGSRGLQQFITVRRILPDGQPLFDR